MKISSWSQLIFVPLFVVAAGCTSPNPNAGYGYCDDSGCYECDLEDNCFSVPMSPCQGETTCGPGEHCTNIGCAAPCTGTEDCTSDLHCTAGFCVPPVFRDVKPYTPPSRCSQNEDCSVGQFCETGSCKPKCVTDEACGPGAVCSSCGRCQSEQLPATCGTLAMFCSDTEPCADGKFCIAGRCHFGCETSAECPIGQVCENQRCTDNPAPASPECLFDTECGDGLCINGYCHPACNIRDDCGERNTCLLQICQPDFS